MTRVAILDDYQNAALEVADWSSLRNRMEVTIFNDHLSEHSVFRRSTVVLTFGDEHVALDAWFDDVEIRESNRFNCRAT